MPTITFDDDSFISQLNTCDVTARAILFIQPYGACLSLLQYGLKCGDQIIVLTAQTDLRMVPDEITQSVLMTIIINTANETDVLRCVSQLQEKIKFRAVIPGFEYFVPLAAKLCEYLQLPGLASSHVMQLRRKDLMRTRLQQAGVIQPKFKLVKSMRELNQAVDEIGFPAICKPVDAAGSVYVKKVMNKTEAQLAALAVFKNDKYFWGHELSGLLLVEEYVEGKEFSLEGVVQQGNIMHFSLTEKFVADQHEFIEVGHIVNTPICNEYRQAMEDYVEKVLDILGADNCPFHAELRLCEGQPILMEIAARLAGDKIGDLINLSGCVNYFDYVYAAYCGEQLANITRSDESVGIRFFYRPEISAYSNIGGLEQVKHYPIEELSIYYKPGCAIPAFPKPLRRLGHVIAKNKDYNALLTMLDRIDTMMVFQ